MKHFEGKLKVEHDRSLFTVEEKPRQIAQAYSTDQWHNTGEANALHLASCWNAMEGMEPERLDAVLGFADSLSKAAGEWQCNMATRMALAQNLKQALRRLRKEGA